jgi:hypothetical protein
MVQHSEQKKTEFLTRVLQGRNSKGRVPLLKDDIKCVTRSSTILCNDANTRLAHFSLAVVGGDQAHVIREIKEQISWLEEEAQAKPPAVGKACSSLDTNVHAQQLM